MHPNKSNLKFNIKNVIIIVIKNIIANFLFIILPPQPQSKTLQLLHFYG